MPKNRKMKVCTNPKCGAKYTGPVCAFCAPEPPDTGGMTPAGTPLAATAPVSSASDPGGSRSDAASGSAFGADNDDVHVRRGFDFLHRRYPSLGDRHNYTTQACCAVLRRGELDLELSSEEVWHRSTSSGSGGAMGSWRQYIQNHKKWGGFVDGSYRSGDAEVRMLDCLEQEYGDEIKGLIVCLKVSSKPCRSCQHALYEFSRAYVCLVVAKFPEGENWLDGRVS